MTLRVALNHKTAYTYARAVTLYPQLIRLRPAPHCRTQIVSYSLKVSPAGHFLNWQQDPQGNFLARVVFPRPVDQMRVEVDLVAEMTVINPFDFFLESEAEYFPFRYDAWLGREIAPFLVTEPLGPGLTAYLESIDRARCKTVDFLVRLNQRLQEKVRYVIRLEPGVQGCEETLRLGSGSCRDSAWLLVQVLRHLGLAARFVSGYLIQLAPDVKPLEGPPGPEQDFTDLHAWAEVYLPGAGWVGLDPTSGLMAGEGHLPLACTPDPASAAPISGAVEPCQCDFQFQMALTRIHEDPRVTRPYTERQWEEIQTVGQLVDQRLRAGDVRLTMGGEPTFISIDDMEGAEWNTEAVGLRKRQLAWDLIGRLRSRFAPGGLLHVGQGKWYPGEPLPRWAFSCYWRVDGQPVWTEPRWLADEQTDYGVGPGEAERFLRELAAQLEVEPRWVRPAYEDTWYYLWRERKLPVNVDPRDAPLEDPQERDRLARVFEGGFKTPRGFVLPLSRQWWQARDRRGPVAETGGQSLWRSGPWPFRSDPMFLIPGDSPLGLRLPLESLPWVSPEERPVWCEVDPMLQRGPLPERPGGTIQPDPSPTGPGGCGGQPAETASPATLTAGEVPARWPGDEPTGVEPAVGGGAMAGGIAPAQTVRTALCVEPRSGRLYIFMPPLERAEDYLELVAAIERTAAQLELPVVLEGYTPPPDYRLNFLKVTPDPGVIEVNIHPARDWDELVANTTTLYEEARQARLGTDKFDLDGTHTGTGGGNHVVLGGPTPADSPFLRRPDLLRSLLAYWNNHPALSYVFSGRFIGPTSQAPRVDEGRRDALYELELAFQQVRAARAAGHCPPWLVDRVFRHLLTDLTGNTHRAEFCIDKLFSPDTSSGRLGLVEFRALEMPPHARMSLTQQLLLRALVARFWETPYEEPLVEWGTALHDRFMLPYFLRRDLDDVIAETARAGFPLQAPWFAPHGEFRFPLVGRVAYRDIQLELRKALEPWYVLGEEAAAGGTARYVDSSVERLEVMVDGLTDARHVVTCNGRRLPLHPCGVVGRFVAGVRYRAWRPPSCLHPTIGVHTPLVFDVLDTWLERSIGGCTYHVDHPGGVNPPTFPVNAFEAESRRAARFFAMGHTPGSMCVGPLEVNPDFPLTLDLRRVPPAA